MIRATRCYVRRGCCYCSRPEEFLVPELQATEDEKSKLESGLANGDEPMDQDLSDVPTKCISIKETLEIRLGPPTPLENFRLYPLLFLSHHFFFYWRFYFKDVKFFICFVYFLIRFEFCRLHSNSSDFFLLSPRWQFLGISKLPVLKYMERRHLLLIFLVIF